MPIFGAKSRAMRGCASKLACGRRIDPADCTVFTVICGEFATSRRADVGIGPYRVLREFTAAHRADRGVRPCASLGNPTQNRKTIVFDRLNCHPTGWQFFQFNCSCGKSALRLDLAKQYEFAESLVVWMVTPPDRSAQKSGCLRQLRRPACLPSCGSSSQPPAHPRHERTSAGSSCCGLQICTR